MLGLLSQAPQHGYGLYQRICIELEGLWHIEMNRLYALLEELSQAGLIQGRDEQEAGHPVRRVFQPTAKGRRHFEAWLRAPSSTMQEMRVDFPVKLFFAMARGLEATHKLLVAQREACRAQMDRLSDQRRALASRSACHSLVYDFRARQIQAAIKWLEACQRQHQRIPARPLPRRPKNKIVQIEELKSR